MKFGIIDIALLILFLLFIVRGIKRGFVREIASFFGIIAAIVLARIYYHLIALSVAKWIVLSPSILSIVSFFLTFTLFYSLALLAGFMLHAIVKDGVTGLIDKFLGGIFSFAKIVVLVAVAIFFLTNFKPVSASVKNIVKSSPVLSIINSRVSLSSKWLKNPIKRLKRIKDSVLQS